MRLPQNVSRGEESDLTVAMSKHYVAREFKVS